MDHRTRVRLAHIMDQLSELSDQVQEILEWELTKMPDSPDGYARAVDVAKLLGVSETPARLWIIRNGALKNPAGFWELPWNHVMELFHDPTIRKPKSRPGSLGLVKNLTGRSS